MDSILPVNAAADASVLPQPVSRALVNPVPTAMVEGSPVAGDDALLAAAGTNRRRVQVRIDQARWAPLQWCVDVIIGDTNDFADQSVAEMHRDPSVGVGAAPHAYEVLATRSSVAERR